MMSSHEFFMQHKRRNCNKGPEAWTVTVQIWKQGVGEQDKSWDCSETRDPDTPSPDTKT